MDRQTLLLLCAFGGTILLFASVRGVLRLRAFLGERRYLRMELRRTEGKERRYYERELRRLYRDLLPFRPNPGRRDRK